jgi:hypothetical protein
MSSARKSFRIRYGHKSVSKKMITDPQQFCPNCGTGVMATGKGTGINVSQLIKLPS